MATTTGRGISYDEPFAWWGPRWEPPRRQGLAELIEAGVLSTETAARLWSLVERRASLVVVAGPGGAGKTTLLTALVDLLPSGTRRLYLRGGFEPFAFLADPGVRPEASALLVNEISPHLPVYLWDAAVRRTLRAGRQGFQILATAHAADVEGFVASLASYPLRVPVPEIAALHVVVRLGRSRDGRGFAVDGTWGLLPTVRDGLEPVDLADPEAVARAVTRHAGAPAAAALARTLVPDAELAARSARLRAEPARFRAPPPPRWADLDYPDG